MAASMSSRSHRVVGAAYLVFVVLFFCFMAQDACMDAGGSINGLPWSCVEYRAPDFVPLAARPWTFWMLVFTVPVVPTALVAAAVRAVMGAAQSSDKRIG
jgi:hypothetical protein